MTGAFERFLRRYRAEDARGAALDRVEELFPSGVAGPADLLVGYAGATFENGLYRLHTIEAIPKWDGLVGDAFPAFRARVRCFGYDWLGRQFALDRARIQGGEWLVLMIEPGTGQALEIPATFRSFHSEELVDYDNEALASEFFREWRSRHGRPLLAHECVGYRVPLFLGGEDDVENLEIIDLEVYWTICGQLLNKTRELPLGTTIGSVAMERTDAAE